MALRTGQESEQAAGRGRRARSSRAHSLLPEPAPNKPEQEREERGLIGLEDMIDMCLKEAKGLSGTNWAEVKVDLEMRDQGRGVKSVCLGGVAG